MTTEKANDAHKNSGNDPEIHKFFRTAIKTGASDLHMKVGQPPKLRIKTKIRSTTGSSLTNEAIKRMVFEILSDEQQDTFLKNGVIDFGHNLAGEGRFRINVFSQRGMTSLAARCINSKILPFESLNLPPVLERISNSTQGLILVVGTTGSGKTTTIVSMINHINQTRSDHIVTIEDPIEYLFQDAKSIVSQIEIGIDIPNFELALKYVVRQDPDVIFVGEMRDAKTAIAAMQAAQTGHLVFGTLHSSNTSQAIQRILDMFPQNEKGLARQTLSLTLNSIVAQLLLPCHKKGLDKVPAIEILLANTTVRKLISEGRESDLPSIIQSCEEEGMQSFTSSLCKLIQGGFIEPREAYKYAPNVEALKMTMKGIKSSVSGIL